MMQLIERNDKSRKIKRNWKNSLKKKRMKKHF